MTEPPAALADHRRRKDAFFSSGRGPLSPERREQFTGLRYYPYAPGLSFQLPLEGAGGEVVLLQTTTGEERQMQAYGTVRVPFEDGEATLTLYAPPGEGQPGSLFLPFRDAGSGRESYGAGRYLDVPVAEQEGQPWVRLDFNLAYHPYCAYGEGWTCPLPPAENWLALTVRAGERLP